MGINAVSISGNLTRDPELRATQGGTQVLHLGVAVNDRRRNQQTGEWEDYPNFVDCVMFGARAEAIARYLAKGTKVAIEGRLRYSSWEKDGQRRSKIEVVVGEIEFLSSSQQAPQSYAPQPQYQQQAYVPQQQYQRTAPQQPPMAPAAAPQPVRAAPQAVRQQPMAPQQPYGQPMRQQPSVDPYDVDIPF